MPPKARALEQAVASAALVVTPTATVIEPTLAPSPTPTVVATSSTQTSATSTVAPKPTAVDLDCAEPARWCAAPRTAPRGYLGRIHSWGIDVGSSNNTYGRRPQTAGIIVHATRGGARDDNLEVEYVGTVRYMLQTRDHLIARRGGPKPCVPGDRRRQFGLAPGLLDTSFLGIHLAQPRADVPFTPFSTSPPRPSCATGASSSICPWCT